MSRQFSLGTVFRMVTNELLAQFFVQLENPCWGMDWQRRPRRHVESVQQCMDYFECPQREAAELILRHVFDLACRSGIEAIRDAARLLQGDNLLRQIPESMNPHCQAMWTWLNAPQVFEQALLYHQVEELSWWSKRDDLPRVAARTDAETLDWFAGDVARLLQQKQGRGRQCTIEHISREDGTDYFFCFPDDYVKTVMVHNRSGRLVTKTLRQTFEIVFAWSRQQGTLEISARLGKRLKQQLEESFAWMILDEQVGPRAAQKVYDLNRLKERHFQLDTDPSDNILARLQRLWFKLPDRIRSIMLESKDGPCDDMRDMVEKYLIHEHCSLEDLNIIEARFQLQFARTTGRGRGSMTFDVAHPDRCNLRRHRPERVAVARKHLRIWRITR